MLTELQVATPASWTEWCVAARTWYSVYYIFDEHSAEELKYLTDQMRVLNDSLPADKRKGVHIVAACGGCMGEDVYVVDGQLQRTIHRRCAECSEAALLMRWEPPRAVCANCGYAESC